MNSAGSRVSCCHSTSCRSQWKYCSSRSAPTRPSLYFQCAAMPSSATRCISSVRICTSNGTPRSLDHRRVQRLIAVRPRHRDEVLEPPRHRRPHLMDDAEHGVAVLHVPGDHPQRQEVVDLIERDVLALQLLMDRPEALDAALDRPPRESALHPASGRSRLRSSSTRPSVARRRVSTCCRSALVRGRLDVPERQLLQLVLELAHAQPMGDRRVDVARLLRDADPPVFRQVMQRAHVVQAIGELDEDDADVVDHRQQHLAEALRLALLARGELQPRELRHALDDVRHLLAEQLPHPLDGVRRVLDDVVQQPGGDGDHVQPHVGQQVGHLERVHQVGLPGSADLPLVLVRPRTRRPAAAARCRRPDWPRAPSRADLRSESWGGPGPC